MAGEEGRAYAYHGIRLVSELALPLPPAPFHDAETLHVRGPLPRETVSARPLWTSRFSGYSLVDQAGTPSLAGPEVTFRIAADELSVEGAWLSPAAQAYLLGGVFALWSELRGRPVLHASCVLLGAGAVALVAPSGGGKSTLAAALAFRGGAIVGDDVVPLEERADGFFVRPGRQETRLWPDTVRHLAGDEARFPRVLPTTEKRVVRAGGAWPGPSAPLRAILVLERGVADGRLPLLEQLDAPSALVALLANGFMAEPAEALGLGPHRLGVLSRVIRTIGVHRLSFPSSLAALDEVCDLVEIAAAGRA